MTRPVAQLTDEQREQTLKRIVTVVAEIRTMAEVVAPAVIAAVARLNEAMEGLREAGILDEDQAHQARRPARLAVPVRPAPTQEALTVEPPVMVYDDERGWQPLGHIVSTGRDPFMCAPPDWQPDVVDWARQFGKSAGVLTATIEAPLTDGIRALVDALFAEHRAHRDRRIRRLASDLGLWPEAARHQFDAVQRVLEATGIGDGYGRLTIPQPVRPPTPAPDLRRPP